jgi:hypothetical protein
MGLNDTLVFYVPLSVKFQTSEFLGGIFNWVS